MYFLGLTGFKKREKFYIKNFFWWAYAGKKSGKISNFKVNMIVYCTEKRKCFKLFNLTL